MKAGWEVKALGEVCTFLGGGTPSKERADFWDGDIPWVSPKDMKSDIISTSIDKITAAAIAGSATKRIPIGSILIVVRSGILARTIPTGITACELTVNQDIKALAPKKSVTSHFLAYYMQSMEAEILDLVTRGATVHRLDTGAIKSLPIPLPPLDEQKRIVAVLDAAFDGLARARANTEANLQNAQELFEGAVDSLFQADLQNWQTGPLSKQVGAVSTGPFGSVLHKSDYVEGQTPIVNPAHIVDGRIEPDQRKTITDDAKERLASYLLCTGDIVIGRRGEMGRCAVVGETENGWLCGTGSFFIRPNGKANSDFVAHLLRSKSYVARLESIAGGATMPNISNKDLADLEVALPSLTQQVEYLVKIDTLLAETSALQSHYRAKLADLDDLRQALLQKAFAGQLC